MRQILSGLFVLFLCINLFATNGNFGGGTGTFQDPYLIEDCLDLQAVDSHLDANVKLANTINCADSINWNSGQGFNPIGNGFWNSFKGDFNGSNYSITGLYINRTGTVGLFENLEQHCGSNGCPYEEVVGIIHDFNIVNANITGGSETGIAVGQNFGRIVKNVHTSGTVQGTGNTGGLIGLSHVGYNEQSSSSATVTGGDNTGGLIGQIWGGTVRDSFATGTVQGTNYTGGLIGLINDGSVSTSFATGNVTGVNRVGGLIGWAIGSLSNVYATGNVSGTDQVGGLIGQARSDNSLYQGFSSGTVTSPGSKGGLIGYDGGTVQNSFWNKETSGLETSFGGTGKTTVQLLEQTTYTNWNFSTIWDFNPNIGHPTLQWEERAALPIVYATSGTFSSKKINLGSGKKFNTISFDANIPSGTSISLQIRAATSELNLNTAPWLGPDGTSNTYYTTSGSTLSNIIDGNSWVQWRAILATNNNSISPTLSSVNISTQNKSTGSAIFTGWNSNQSRLFTKITATQNIPNQTNISWSYCTQSPCINWTGFTSGSTLTLTTSELYLKAEMTPSTTNITPSITSIRIDYTE